MLAGAAINNGIAPAGIISDHSSHHGPVGGRGFRAKKEPIWLKEHVQLIPDHGRFYPNPFLIGIHPEYPGKFFGEVDDDSISDHLSGQRGSSRPRDQ